MNTFEATPVNSPKERSADSKEDIIKQKGDALREKLRAYRSQKDFFKNATEKAKEIGVSAEEYLIEYAEKEDTIREDSDSPSAVFELSNPAGSAINNLLHEKIKQGFLADHDTLTGLLNRRAFEENVRRRQAIIKNFEQQPEVFSERRQESQAHTEQQDYRRHYSIMFIDADKFKSVNTEYGHDAGDTVLKEIAKTIKEKIRDNEGVVARWGGEEIVALVPVDIDIACAIAERIRTAVEQRTFRAERKRDFHVTISIGIAPYQDDSKKQIKTADMAVQAAKGDFSSVKNIAESLGGITVEEDLSETRNQIQFVDKNGILSRFKPKE
ncbi:MAG: GGDEF domain-containing protein [Candidatus Moraniibacteriota bacterium]|nr:MAG: GGDEF domain-containing protein [Candidatus Moranbacteria bacterium]